MLWKYGQNTDINTEYGLRFSRLFRKSYIFSVLGMYLAYIVLQRLTYEFLKVACDHLRRTTPRDDARVDACSRSWLAGSTTTVTLTAESKDKGFNRAE